MIYFQRKFVQVGGSELFALNLINNLPNSYDFKIFTFFISDNFKNYLNNHFPDKIINSIEILNFNPISKNFFLYKFIINREKIFVTNYGLEELVFLKLIIKIRSIYLAHDMIHFNEFYSYGNKSRLFIEYAIIKQKFLESFMNEIVVLTNKAKDDRKKAFNINCKVMSAAINNIQIQEKIFNKKENINFLIICRLEKKKNVDSLIKVWPSIYSLYSNSVLHIVGSGSQMNYLTDLANSLKCKNVNFYGFIDDNKKKRLLKISDVFYSLDKADFDIVMYEALSFGIPVVFNKEQEVDEILIENDWLCSSSMSTQDLLESTITILQKNNKDIKILANTLKKYLFSEYSKKFKNELLENI